VLPKAHLIQDRKLRCFITVVLAFPVFALVLSAINADGSSISHSRAELLNVFRMMYMSRLD
jgi:hypothetical protein